jgi:hypothetical protein
MANKMAIRLAPSDVLRNLEDVRVTIVRQWKVEQKSWEGQGTDKYQEPLLAAEPMAGL